MKKPLILATVLFIVFLTVTACTINGDSLKKDELGISTASFKLKIDDACMINDFGVYSEAKNEIGIVVYGNVESGKIYENSQMIFKDKNGKFLYSDKVFKIAIIEINTGTAQESRRQSYAESGDNVALYLKGWNGGDTELYSKYERNLELIRESQFAELE